MKYSEGRALFEAAWLDTTSWSARIHDALFKSSSNIAQDQRLVKFRTECIASSAKLWEIRSYSDRYFGVVSAEKKVSVIVEGNEEQHISMHVDDVVTSIAVDFKANMFHVFIGQKSGKVIHTRLNPMGAGFVFEPVTFDLPVASSPILHIVPNTYRQVVFPDKFWVITNSAISLHRFDQPYVKSLAEYSAPSSDLLNVEYQHPLLAVHYLSKDNTITSIMIHVFATHFYAESAKTTLKIHNTPMVNNNFTGSKCNLALCKNVVPNSSLPLHKGPDMLSHVQFSFEMFVLTERSINYAIYQTKEFAIREKLLSLGNRALTSAKWITESEALVDITVQHHKFQLSSDNDQVTIARHGSVPIWEAILQQRVYSPSRETILNTLNNNPRIDQNQKFREIIMEALVVLGLHQIISESIQLRVNTSIGHQYAIADIQKMFEWVTISDLGLFVHAEKSLETILEGDFLEYVKGNVNKHQVHVVAQLQEIQSIANSITSITQAFLDRKSLTMQEQHIDVFHDVLVDDLIVQSYVELVFLHERAIAFSKLTSLLLIFISEMQVNLTGLSMQTGGEVPIAIHQHGCMQLPVSMVNMLPDYLMSDKLLYHALVLNMTPLSLDPALFELCDMLHSRWLTRNGDSIKKMMLLPWRVVSEVAYQLMKDKKFVGKTLQQSLDEIKRGWDCALRVLIYIVFESDFVGQKSVEKELCHDYYLALMASTLDLPREELYWVRALHSIDSTSHVEMAVEKFCLATGLQFLEDNELLVPVIQRLFCTDQLTCGWKFMESLGNRDHNILYTKLGAVAVAVAQPVEDRIPLKWKAPQNNVSDGDKVQLWEEIWNSARRYGAKVRPFHDCLMASRDMTSFMCKWAIKNKHMSHFLQSKMELSEVEEIIALIRDRSTIEIQNKLSPSPAVDTLVSFYLKHHRIEEAKKLHEEHLQAIQGRTQSNDVREMLKDRAALLAVHSRIPAPPSVDYRMQLNLARIRCIK